MEDQGKRTGKGRGAALLQLAKERRPGDSAVTSPSQTQYNVPNPTEMPSSSTTEHGGGYILSTLKSLEYESPPGARIEIPGVGDVPVEEITNLARRTSDTPNYGILDKLPEMAARGIENTPETYSPLKPRFRQGTGGSLVNLSGNYINLKLSPGKGLFNYEVKFNPDIESRPLRRKLLNQHLEALGRTKVFDGVTLYLPQKLEQDTITLESIHPMDQSKVDLKVIFKKKQTMSENVPFFNVLLGRVLRSLSLVRIGQHNFNPKGIRPIPQHKLEVWPGYATAITAYEGGLKLCIDARHRVMRTETIRDVMTNFKSKWNFKDAIVKELVGLSVFTRYNNRTYRVDDIAWDKNPTYEFVKGTGKVSLMNYYKFHWNIEIQDETQPLLVHNNKRKSSVGQAQEKMILLVPELCYLASLSNSVRSDFRIMKDLMAVTQMTPNARRDTIRHFVQEIQNNDIPRGILAEWGLYLEPDIMEFIGRVFEPEIIYIGKNKKIALTSDRPIDWGSTVTRSDLLRTPSLRNWFILYCYKDTRCTRDFIGMFRNVTRVMGMNVSNPQMICLRDDRIETYVEALRNNIESKTDLIVIVFPTNRTDRYSAVKRVCCVETAKASQVIMSRTISRGDKLKSITEKIALQINCKLGGALWALAIPLDNCMICGIDVYHAGSGESKESVAGFVASLDKSLTLWHSKICIQSKRQEIIDMLQMCLISAVKTYHKYNMCYPDRIIIYRDGVSDGQLEIVIKYEIKQLLASFKSIEVNYEPTLTVVIVQKRINSRIFERSQFGLSNPSPGTVVDCYITKPDVYDFFLVSQNIRQGTVSPTRYIVVYDSKNMRPEHIQRLTYKLCYLYYNWPGTIKVPAPCQYAHKLVSLVGQSLQLEPHYLLANTLYYL